MWISRIRIGFGLTAVIAPRLAARVLRGNAERGTLEPLFARMAGARDIALGLGTVLAIDKGAPVRGWLEGSALSDTADCLSALAARKQLTPRASTGTAILSGTSAVLCGLLARRLDPPPDAHPHQPEAVVTGHHE